MSNNTQLLSRPVKNGGNFNAVGNGIIYKLRRVDSAFDAVNNVSGIAQIQINGVDLTAYFQEDNEVFVSGYGVGVITAVSFSGGNTLINTDLYYGVVATGYINNLSKRTDYKVEVEVFDADTDQPLGPRLVYDFNREGEVFADVSGLVRAYVKANWENASQDEEETYQRFYIQYQEFFDQTYWELIDDGANLIVGVFGFIPLTIGNPPNFTRYAHGGNLLPYIPNTSALGKWLTRFVMPVIWRGFPFSFSVLWSNPTINIRQKEYTGENVEVLNVTEAHAGTIYTVRRIAIAPQIPQATKMLLSLEHPDSLNPMTEEIEVEVRDPCENPVLLFWKNSLGGDSFWMFDESQDLGYANSSGTKVKRLTLFADNLTVDQWEALNELNSLSDVFRLNIVDYAMDNSIDKTHYRDDNQVYIVSSTGEKLGVVVVNNDNKTRMLNRKHSIQLTIELPALFTV